MRSVQKGALVRDLMSRDVKTVGPNQTLLDADQIAVVARVRHLPVVDEEGALTGLITDRDVFHSGLLRALGFGDHARRKAAESLRVKEVMRTQVFTVGPDAPVAEAARVMVRERIGCLPVVDGGDLVGILTETDLVSWVAQHG